MFAGHEFIKIITDTWVFDLTEFIGYKVELNNDNTVKSYEKAFQVVEGDNGYEIDKFIKVPTKILKETLNQIKKYIED